MKKERKQIRQMHFLSSHCCCQTDFQSWDPLPWSSVTPWFRLHTSAHACMEASYLCASRIYKQHWIYYLLGRAFYECTIFICTSPGLLFNCTKFYKAFCIYYVHQWFPTPVRLSQCCCIFTSQTHSKVSTEKKSSALGVMWVENNWYTHTPQDVSPFYPHFKCDR